MSCPTKEESPPRTVISPPARAALLYSKNENASPPKNTSLPKSEVMSPPKTVISLLKNEIVSPPKGDAPLPPKRITSPPVSTSTFKTVNTVPKGDTTTNIKISKEPVTVKEVSKIEKINLVEEKLDDKNINPNNPNEIEDEKEKPEESNGVGDKIKKFEKAAEDASVGVGRLSRPGSMRGRSRTERLGSDSKDDLPPPATPFKDNVHFELNTNNEKSHVSHGNDLDHQPPAKNNSPNLMAMKWQKSLESNPTEEKIKKPEPQKIIKPEFKPMPSSIDVTIRSPSLGAKIPDQFPSHGTAFRNVASPDAQRNIHKFNEEMNTQNNFKTCKFKPKEKYSVSKGSSYFTRGSEEIWLVKKKDIEEIEERVLDSFRRAGGNICMRSESMRPSSDSGQGASFTHATMGRTKRQMYARSESLDPQWASARAQTLKRQSSVACTCGHDKKTRAKSAAEMPARPRSRSHGDDTNQGHVLDKYETLV